jgi:hypothetical protein
MRDESRRIVGFVVPRSLRVSCSLTAEAGKISRSASAPQRSAPAAFFFCSIIAPGAAPGRPICLNGHPCTFNSFHTHLKHNLHMSGLPIRLQLLSFQSRCYLFAPCTSEQATYADESATISGAQIRHGIDVNRSQRAGCKIATNCIGAHGGAASE